MGLIKTKPRKTQRFLTQITNSLTGACPVTAAMLGKCTLSMLSQASLLLLLLLAVCSISLNLKSSTFTFIHLALHLTKLIPHCIVPETMWIVDKSCATYIQSDLDKNIQFEGQKVSEKYHKTEQSHI